MLPIHYASVPRLPLSALCFRQEFETPFGLRTKNFLLVAGLEPAPTMLCHGRPRPKLYQLSYTNIEAVRS